jgi:hypothetical protein
VLNDGSKTPVAESHRSNIGIIEKPRQAGLEIHPRFEQLMDILLTTYTFVEKTREDRERELNSKNAHVVVKFYKATIRLVKPKFWKDYS